MSENIIQTCGDQLYAAMVNKAPIRPLTESHPDMSLETAYQISLHMLERRLAAGEKVIGKKIGLTSLAAQTTCPVWTSPILLA